MGRAYSALYSRFGGRLFSLDDCVEVLGRDRNFCRVLLSRLGREGLLRAEGRGRRRRYGLLDPLEFVLEAGGFFAALSRVRQEVYRPILRRVMLEVRRRLGDELVSLVVFGSVARGSAKAGSDVDLLVVAEGLPPSMSERMRFFTEVERSVLDLELGLWRERGVYASVQFYPLSRDEASVFRPLYLDMVLDAVFLFDRDGFMEGVLRRLGGRLEELGSRRVELPSGGWYWVLKPDLAPGEVVEV